MFDELPEIPFDAEVEVDQNGKFKWEDWTVQMFVIEPWVPGR